MSRPYRPPLTIYLNTILAPSSCHIFCLVLLASTHALFGERNGNPLQYSCLENPVDRGPWWAAVHRVAQSRTRLKWLSMHALEKEMATHSSIPACRIPGTEEPGGLSSMRLHRVGHDWSDLAAASAAACTVSLFTRSLAAFSCEMWAGQGTGPGLTCTAPVSVCDTWWTLGYICRRRTERMPE